MLFILFLFLVKLDSDDDRDEALKQFDGLDIKIFFSAYPHYHLAVKTKGDRKDSPFVAINKYMDMENYGVNDMAKLNVNGDGYEITIGTDMICTSKNKNLIKCGEEDTDTIWKILPATFGYQIQKNNKCLTKSQTETLTLKKCTGDDDQKFDFKKFVGIDKCDEAKNQKDKNENESRNSTQSNINIRLIPPIYGYDDMFYLSHPQTMPMHQPKIYSNVYGFTNNELFEHDHHVENIPHISMTKNTESKTMYEPQKILTLDTHVEPVLKTIEPVEVIKKTEIPNDQQKKEEIYDKADKKDETSKNQINYRLFDGFNSNTQQKTPENEKKLFVGILENKKLSEKQMQLFRP